MDLVAPAASQPNTKEGAERALQLFQTGGGSLGDYADPGIKRRRAGFYYVTQSNLSKNLEVRKAAGTRKDYGRLGTAKHGRNWTERPAAMAKVSQKVLNARTARGGRGNVAHEMPAAEAKRKATKRKDTLARLPYVHGLSATLICDPSYRCANCTVIEADGGLLATGCSHFAALTTGFAKLSIDDWSKLNNSTHLSTSAEMASKCVTCYARDSGQAHLLRNFKEAIFCGALMSKCEEAKMPFVHMAYTHADFEYKGAVVRDDFRVEAWGVDTEGNRVSACLRSYDCA